MNFKRIVLIIPLLICLTIVSFSQLRERDEESKSLSQKSQQQQQQMISSSLSVIMDGPVDPKEYIVGPGDIFAVSIWAAVPLNFQVPVTPEGSVIIPTVNEVAISGLTLDDAKKLVMNEIKKKYLSGNASFTLFSPRTFVVTVKGAIKEEGKRYIQATQRVDMVVNFRKDDRENIDTTIAQRNIVLEHKDGSRYNVDIEKYYATKKTEYNPLLRDGDVIIIPQKAIKSNFIAVYGAVNKQGLFEFADGDSLVGMLAIARGLSKIADSSKVVITRYINETTPEYIKIDLRKIIDRSYTDISLKRGDQIVVYEQYIQQRSTNVSVTGEVIYPGTYPISKDSTFLSEIIRLAGGVTKYASLKNSQLYRRSVNSADIEIERLESGRGGITPEDSAYYYLETDIRINRELVVSDFTELIEKNNSSKDVLLRDGDEIHISSKKKTVYVFGQVVNPGHILFTPNKNIDYYISLAGGVTVDARSDIKVIKAATRQWLDPNKTVIEEGDYVWIPKEPYRPFSYYLTVYSQVFGIIATVVSLVILVAR
ncbi:MAG: SLBB domain-containing protein [Bacteroidota bacterium]|nr:SLBB domain-containing protein [Bacteroidota bacterium]